MGPAKEAIRDLVNRETRAWDAKDADGLLAIFHSDMVWPYTKVGRDWKLIMHTGLLDYGRPT